MNEERRHNDDALLDEIKSLRRDIELFKKEVNERMAPMDNLKGFWKVLGFVLGAVALMATGTMGISYLYHLFKNILFK